MALVRERVAVDDVEALFRSDYRRLVGLARLLVDDRGQAEEVVQDAFADLYRRRGRVDAPAAWLRTAVVNGARGRLRRRATARRHLRAADRRDAAPADEGVGVDDDRRAVAAALAGLPDRQRACIALRFYDGCSEAEIAELLGISAGSVKTHVHRGMATLAAALEDLR
jgi:RNA polymerase sigma-70 factor (sigma-E family)